MKQAITIKILDCWIPSSPSCVYSYSNY